jgi:hypothetical protein
MSKPIPPEVARRIRRQRIEMLLSEIKGGAWFAVLLGLVLACVAYLAMSPVREVGRQQGIVQGFHLAPNDDGPETPIINVLLDNGRHVGVSLPRGAPPSVGSRVELRVLENVWPPKRTKYRFGGHLSDDESERPDLDANADLKR